MTLYMNIDKLPTRFAFRVSVNASDKGCCNHDALGMGERYEVKRELLGEDWSDASFFVLIEV